MVELYSYEIRKYNIRETSTFCIIAIVLMLNIKILYGNFEFLCGFVRTKWILKLFVFSITNIKMYDKCWL